MDTFLLTTLINPTPVLTSWFTWLKPSTAPVRIAHDITHFINLYAANHAPNQRFIVIPHDAPIQDPRVAEYGFGLPAIGERPAVPRRLGIDVREGGERAAERVHQRRTTTASTTRVTRRPNYTPEEEARRYLKRSAERKRIDEAKLSRQRAEMHQQAERERRARIARENEPNSALNLLHQGGAGTQQDADRAWVRSRRNARAKCTPAGQGQDSRGTSVWGMPKPKVEVLSEVARTAGLEMGVRVGERVKVEGAIEWGNMPALGS